MKKKFYLIIALVLALVISSGVYAYTWTTATATISPEAADGDFATCNATATQPDWESVQPGPAGTEILRPNATGDETEIPHQYLATGEHWDKVDDEPVDEPDDWETYVYTLGAAGKTDLYNLSAPSASETINKVTLYFRFSGDSVDSVDSVGYAEPLIKTHGTLYRGSEESQLGKTFVTRSYQWASNPDTGEAWTWNEIDALQIGVELKGSLVDTGTGAGFCTQVYVEVDYAGIPAGDVPTGNLFIVTPHPDYTGDLLVKVYLTNTGVLTKAYQYLNMKLALEDAVEDYSLLTLDNGVATFNLQDCAGVPRILSVTGGSYCLVSADTSEWGAGWSVEPEFYCEVSQR